MKAFGAAVAAILLYAGAASAQALSPDGTILLPGTTGTVVALSGKWAFNSANDATLNGVAKTSNWPTNLTIAGAGNLYAYYGAAQMWYVWWNGVFTVSPTPVLSTPGPAGPPGPPGPTGGVGPTGPMGIMGVAGTIAQGLPVAGSACTSNDSLFNIVRTATPAVASIYLCDATLHWSVFSLPVQAY